MKLRNSKSSKAFVSQFNKSTSTAAPTAKLKLRKSIGRSQTKLEFRKLSPPVPPASKKKSSVIVISSDSSSASDSEPLPIARHKLKSVVTSDDEDTKEQSARKETRLHHKGALESLIKKRLKHPSMEVDQEEEEEYNSYDEGDKFLDDELSDASSIVDPFAPAAPHTKPVETARRLKEKPAKSAKVKMIIADSSSASDNDLNSDEYEDTDESDAFISPEKKTRQSDNWQAEMPVEFSLMGNQSLSSTFNVFIQLLASEALSPGFIAETIRGRDQYYLVALRKIEDAVTGRKNSLISSQAWTTDFRRDLERFPHWSDYQIPSGAECEACNRSGRTATYVVKLSGCEYDHSTLTAHSNGDHSVSYNVGRFCRSRSHIYHQLHHYKFNLLADIRCKLDEMASEDDYEDDQVGLLQEFLALDGYMLTLFHEFKELQKATQSFATGDD